MRITPDWLSFLPVDEHRRFAHFVDVGAELRHSLHTGCEEVDEDRLPIGTDQIEHQRGPIGVPRLRKAVQLILGH